MNISNILVPIDFSTNATVALEGAVDLAQKYQAKIDVIYVIPQVIFHPDWATDIEDAVDINDITEEARHAIANMTEPYKTTGVSINEHILSGGPYIEILRLAKQLNTDLIVIGAHGTSQRKPALMGSVAEKVVRESTCSVFTVRG
jgi:nucleotide-binding universal stress UspA family protein